MKRVLSIDGGGIRGLIPAVLCQKCEEYARRPLSSLFDVIAGTSTGGILALGLAVPPNGKPAKELAEFYFKYGNSIFSSPRNRIGQLIKSKFSNNGLRDASAEVFGSTRISEAITEVFVTAYDTQLRTPLYLTREKTKSDPSLDLMMRDVAIATSAAPTIFQPHRFDRYVLIDGGVALDADKTEVDAAAEALEGVKEQSKVGTRTTIEVLNAEQELLDARIDQVKAQHDRDLAVLQIKAAIGQLTADHLKLPLRPSDMYMKTQYLRERNGGRGVVFATGTPISNTMAEMFTLQRYLAPEMLKKAGVEHFDAWAANFGEAVTSLELAPDGSGYRMHTRFAKFVNPP